MRDGVCYLHPYRRVIVGANVVHPRIFYRPELPSGFGGLPLLTFTLLSFFLCEHDKDIQHHTLYVNV